MPAFVTPLPACGARDSGHAQRLSSRRGRTAWGIRATRSPPSPEAAQKPDDAQATSSCSSTGTIIVPGKFDAFHLGHRKLAAAAAELGSPTLLSFSGMSAALGWAPRPPIVAAVERDRVLRDWSAAVGASVGWTALPFDMLREMSPTAFVDYLVDERAAAGIVCGPDWRFGRQRAGDVDELLRLAEPRGLVVSVVQPEQNDGSAISSTRVRKALADGDVALAERLLGRRHRLVGNVVAVDRATVLCAGFVNMAPGDGGYEAIVRVIGRAEPFATRVDVARDDEGEAVVMLRDAQRVFCVECEIYVDFIDRASDAD